MLTPPVGGSTLVKGDGGNQSRIMASHAASISRRSSGRTWPPTRAAAAWVKGRCVGSRRASAWPKWRMPSGGSSGMHSSGGRMSTGSLLSHDEPSTGEVAVIRATAPTRSPWEIVTS